MKKDLTNQRFGKLVVIKEVGRNKDNRVIWLCKCDCGKYHETLGKYLLSGETTSCGCRRTQILLNEAERLKTHGLTNTRIHNIWLAMKGRCNNPNNSSYKNYGGRGIKVCEEWNDFITFYNWSMNNGYDDSLTIDRINVDGNYEPQNCTWADSITQANNTRRNHYLTYNGETKTMSEWARCKNMTYSTLRARINSYGWSVKEALETPVRKHVIE